MRDRVRSQLVDRDHHDHRPVFRHARTGRASRDPYPQQVQRASAETLVKYDRPCLKGAVTAADPHAATRRRERHSGMLGKVS